MRKILIICDSNTGGIFDYSKILYRKLKDLNIEFLFIKEEDILRHLKFFIKLLRILIKENNIILDIQSLIWPVTVFILPILKLKHHTFLFEAHDDPFSKKLKYRPIFIRKLIYSSADIVIAHSIYCLHTSKKIKEKTFYIPFGPLIKEGIVPDTENAKRELNLEKNVVGIFFGYVQPNKGLDVLLKALPFVISNHKNFKLLIVGPTREDFDKYDKIINELKLKKNIIKVLKYVPIENNKYLEASDFFILPYREITQSAVPFAAYAMKKPVIGSNVGGLEEVIKDGETGFIFEKDNEMDLSNKMNKMIENKDIRLKMGEKGYNLIYFGEFSWKRISKKYLNLFSSICVS